GGHQLDAQRAGAAVRRGAAAVYAHAAAARGRDADIGCAADEAGAARVPAAPRTHREQVAGAGEGGLQARRAADVLPAVRRRGPMDGAAPGGTLRRAAVY